ncbi:response regulator [Pseudolabrys sp. Root1462]|jgi:FixJ family two-component response regulator|uniref:response regulator transcription factor n=1 Tax=Pseudolabrys sp. Root1462 TaxID=1736466 RepID=UPI0009E840E5|nr:response regulator [Pseudolabrys sp. Root1462]
MDAEAMSGVLPEIAAVHRSLGSEFVVAACKVSTPRGLEKVYNAGDSADCFLPEWEQTMAPSLFLVDDNEDVKITLENIFRRKNFIVRSFSNGAEFLTALESDSPDCILLDLQMPSLSGIQLLHILFERQCQIPVFMMSGAGNIPKAVESIRLGALDFFEKPFRVAEVVNRIKEGLRTYNEKCALLGYDTSNELPVRQVLTDREQEVLTLISKGASSKEAGQHLGISPRTIEVHRSRILEKLNARNFVEVSRRIFSRRMN